MQHLLVVVINKHYLPVILWLYLDIWSNCTAHPDIIVCNELFMLTSGCEDVSDRSVGSHVSVHGCSPAHVLWRWKTSPPFTNWCWVWKGKYALLKNSIWKWLFQRVALTISLACIKTCFMYIIIWTTPAYSFLIWNC